jgi:hypothetical protein
MAKDFTKYTIKGVAKNLNKSRLVQTVIEHYCANNETDYENLKLTWIDDIQGGKGIVRLVSEVDEKNERNYYMDAPIVLKDGSKVVVCNQWGKDNISNFIYMAGFEGYSIVADSEDGGSAATENQEIEVQKPATSTVEAQETPEAKTSAEQPEEAAVFGSPGWKVPESLAFIIRHVIVTDNEILEEELNWMQVAFNEFEKENIDIKTPWDVVDDQAQLYEKMGFYDTMVVNVVTYLGEKLTTGQKSTLLAILMEICAQDNIIKHNEYVTLILIAKVFSSGKEHVLVDEPLEKAGIKIEK